MAVYQFSALADGQAISFNAGVDRLNFDQTAIAGGDLELTAEGSAVRVTVKSGPQAGKDVLLTGFSLEQIVSGTNFSFADGSVVRAGDNTVGTASDAAGNALTGTVGRDLLMGLGGNDTLNGGDNNDSLVGGAGNDNLNGNSGNDWLEGGAGNDTLTGSGGQDAFLVREVGAANADLLADFASGWDNIQLDAAALTQIGATGRFAAGDVRFFAGTAAHDADDRIIYNSATGQIFYDADGNGAGAAQLIATLPAGRGVVAGDFVVFGTPAAPPPSGNVINGTAGDDTLIGTPENDTINGLAGNDSLVGHQGADSLNGGDGNDTLDGRSLGEDFRSEESTMTFDPATGTFSFLPGDTLNGGLGDDLYLVQANDVIAADPGGMDTMDTVEQDVVMGDGIEVLVEHSGDGNDVGGVTRLTGNSLDNVIHGTWIGNILDGGDGNDTIFAGFGDVGPTSEEHDTFRLSAGSGNYGNDYLDGEDGWDILDFSDARSAFVADLTAGTLAGGGTGGSGTATLVSIEEVIGGAFADRITGPGAGGVNGVITDFGAILRGNGGNDTIIGGGASEQLFGGDGNDRIVLSGGFDRATGDAGSDTFVMARSPGANPDQFSSASSARITDFVSGGDKIVLDAAYHSGIGAMGNFSAGDARFFAGTAAHDADDRVIWDGGALWYDPDGTGSAAQQLIAVISGNVVATDIAVERGAADQSTTGTAGNDTLVGGSGSDTLDGGAGQDSLSGLAGSDRLIGGDGNDTLDGGADSDSLEGGLGNDTYLNPNPGDQVVDTGGLDTVVTGNSWTLDAGIENLIVVAGGSPGFFGVSGTGNELGNLMRSDGPAVGFDGGAGNDTLLGGSLADGLNGGSGNDSVIGGDGNDSIRGEGGNDWIDAGAGDDVITLASFRGIQQDGSDGVDTIAGGAGIDKLEYDFGATAGAVVDLATGTATGGSPGANASLSGIENVITTRFADYLIGDAGANLLGGLEGNDTLEGGAGNDTLLGGPDEWMSPVPPPYQDVFLFREYGAANADLISDFRSGADTLALDGSVFTQVGAAGRFAAGDARFFAGTAAHDADDRIIFNSATGQIFYDADGNGSGAAQLVASLGDNGFIPPFAATDILVAGSATHQSISGTNGNDSLQGGDGNDTINGLGGNDTLDGRGGSDSVDGGVGNDSLLGGAGADSLYGGDGLDTLDGGADADFGYGGIGDDSIIGGAGNDQMHGEDGNDWLAGGVDNDALFGEAGNDVLDGGDGTDNLDGGGGFDQLFGNLGDDWMFGGNGDDVLIGGDGRDLMWGDAGNDFLSGDAGDDQLSGMQGDDTLLGGDGNDSFVIADSLSPDYGSDSIDGGAGVDRIFFDAQQSGMVVDLRAGTATGGMAGGGGSTIVQNMEYVGMRFWDGGLADRLVASDANTTFSAGDGNDTLVGGAGADSLVGGFGDDVLDGGAGNDTLDGDSLDTMAGASASDTFVFSVAPGAANADVIVRFASGIDQIRLDAGAMSALGPSGDFTAADARFFAGTAAHDADDRVIYNTTNGQLWYDADGNGAGAAQLIATLQGARALAATDIAVDNGSTSSGQTINGTSGNDSLVGGTGDDTLSAFAGNDTLDGGAGADVMDGGTGNDLYFVDDAADRTIDPENGGIDEVRSSAQFYILNDWINNLTLVGSAETGFGNAIDNVITGNGGVNSLSGMAGNDTLIGGGPGDNFNGGDGNDSMVGGNGSDQFGLSTGQDTMVGGAGVDGIVANSSGEPGTVGVVVDLAAGTLTGGYVGASAVLSGIENFTGAMQGDRIVGNAADNNFFGGWGSTNGDDTIFGAGGNDTIYASDSGNDSVSGGAGNDTLTGGGGADHFVFDQLPGAANADLVTDFGRSSIGDGGSFYSAGVDKIHLDASVMTALGASGQMAAGDARFFAGSAAHDADDRVVYDGATGRLWYDADGSGSGTAQLLATMQGLAVAATDIIVDNGGTPPPPPPPPSGGQTIVGTAGNDSLVGGTGNDNINGGSGNDSLAGGAGNDTLTGSGGQDTFVFREFGAANADRMTDFATNWDRIQVDDAAFTAAGAAGRLAAGDGRFFAGAGASAGHDADDRFVFNTSTGQLYYDADGSGSGAAQLIVTAQAGATVAAADITVI